MIIAKVQISGTRARTICCKTITKDMVGAKVSIEYGDDLWAGLEKKVVFTNGLQTKERTKPGATVSVPQEVLDTVGAEVRIGLCGTNADGTLVIPTIWAALDVVRNAVPVEADEAAEPTPPVWAQLLGMIGDLAKLDTDARDNLVAAVNELVARVGETNPVEVRRIVAEYLAENMPEVEMPESLPNPHPLHLTGAVEATYDGSEAVEVVIPQGGGVTPTAAEKIVDYTVDADGASALKFAFTVAEYPALAKYNHLRGIIRRAVNAGMEWVQVCANNVVIGQTPKGQHGMLAFEVLKHGDYYRGSTGGTQNISMYNVWTNASQSSYSGYARLLPAKIDSLTSITVQSWVRFLDEGARIEIWGWNE